MESYRTKLQCIVRYSRRTTRGGGGLKKASPTSAQYQVLRYCVLNLRKSPAALEQDLFVVNQGQHVLEAHDFDGQRQQDAPERQRQDPRVHVSVGALLRHAVHQPVVHEELLETVVLLLLLFGGGGGGDWAGEGGVLVRV